MIQSKNLRILIFISVNFKYKHIVYILYTDKISLSNENLTRLFIYAPLYKLKTYFSCSFSTFFSYQCKMTLFPAHVRSVHFQFPGGAGVKERKVGGGDLDVL